MPDIDSTPRDSRSMIRSMTIGRSAKADFRVHNAYVSSRHASLDENAAGEFFLRDLESANGTFLNSPGKEITGSVRVTENDLIYFSEFYKVSAVHLIHFLKDHDRRRETSPEPDSGSVREFNSERVLIGSAAGCDLQLSYLNVLAQHAEILQSADGTRHIRPLAGPVFVNGSMLSARRLTPLNPRDRVELGGVSISLEFSSSNPRRLTIGAQREGIYFGVRDLKVTVTDRETRQPRHLLQGISLSVYPGELVGLLGPSGCGKSTLLNALAASSRPNGGQILYNGVDLYQNLARFANQTGYVPQDDIMHAELKVREVLYYAARLRVSSSIPNRSIYEKIDKTCGQLGLVDPKSNLDVRNLLVGSPSHKVLSGGQKKRVNLGIELLTDPRALFLDEPTSGLSSFDTRLVMESLRNLATETGIAIIITIHQPSLSVYKLFDKVIYLKSGRLAYFGPAFPESVQHFVPDGDPGLVGPDGIMEKIDELSADSMERNFRASPLWREFVERRRGTDPIVEPNSRSARAERGGPSPLIQVINLVDRSMRCKLRDRPSLAVMAVQAPLVALLLAVAFRGREVNAPLFLLGFVAIWFGTNNTAREIVGEKDILMREFRCGLGVGPYVISKWIVNAIILFVQCLMLCALSKWWVEIDANLVVMTLICFAAGLVGIGIGLLVSALAGSEVTAIVSIPLILIPFIMFGGLVAPYDQAKTGTRILSNLMPSRWAYECLIHAEAENLREDLSFTTWNTDREKPLYRLQEFSRKPFECFLPKDTVKYDNSEQNKYREFRRNTFVEDPNYRQMFDLRTPTLPAAAFVGPSKIKRDKLRNYRGGQMILGLGILLFYSAATGVAMWRVVKKLKQR